MSWNLLSGRALIATLALVANCVAYAEFDASQLATKISEKGEYHLGLFNGEKEDGFMRLGWYRDGDNLILYDRTMMPSAEIYETLRATMSAQDLSPKSVNIRFHQSTSIVNIDALLGPEGVSGSRTVERMGQALETTDLATALPEGALLRAIAFVLPLVLDREPGQKITFDWYAPLMGRVQSIRLSSDGGGTVETPAGTFETVRWKLRGGIPENDIYVSRDAEPRIVRIDVLGQPLRFLAVEDPQDSRGSQES